MYAEMPGLNCYVYYDCGFELVEVCKGFVV